MFRFIKEIYLTWFTLLYRMPAPNWGNPERTKSIRANSFLCLIVTFAVFGIAAGIEVLTGKKFLMDVPAPAIGIVFFAFCFLNFNILVTRGYGIKFESEFDNLNKSRRVFLIVSSLLILLIIFVMFIYIMILSHRRFHSPGS